MGCACCKKKDVDKLGGSEMRNKAATNEQLLVSGVGDESFMSTPGDDLPERNAKENEIAKNLNEGKIQVKIVREKAEDFE